MNRMKNKGRGKKGKGDEGWKKGVEGRRRGKGC